MSKCESCGIKDQCHKDEEKCTYINNTNHNIKKIIAIMSGKGGVGKSSIATLLALELTKKDYKVGILDADISGPSIPRFTHTNTQKAHSDGNGIYPLVSDENIKIMSFNAISENEDQPAIWRGPLINKALQQFYSDVYWDELDFLLIDMPPGTSDVALSVFQLMPINGVIMITTPQPMVAMIVSKALHLCKDASVPIIGLIENMSYLTCPNCEQEIRLYPSDESEKLAKQHHTKVLAKLPSDASVANLECSKIIKKEITSALLPCVAELIKL